MIPLLALAALMQVPIEAPAMSQASCTNDGLIHAEVSPAISAQVKDHITLVANGAQVRDVAKLVLPCGFHLDPRFGWNLILTNGKEFRRYRENNAFGFMPAFGFGEQNTRSYQLRYETIQESSVHVDSCSDQIKDASARLQLCSSFGSATSFFATSPNGSETELAHYVVQDSRVKEDFKVAEIDGSVESIFFLPPPDAPGGTITLIFRDEKAIYRLFVDVPRS